MICTFLISMDKTVAIVYTVLHSYTHRDLFEGNHGNHINWNATQIHNFHGKASKKVWWKTQITKFTFLGFHPHENQAQNDGLAWMGLNFYHFQQRLCAYEYAIQCSVGWELGYLILFKYQITLNFCVKSNCCCCFHLDP